MGIPSYAPFPKHILHAIQNTPQKCQTIMQIPHPPLQTNSPILSLITASLGLSSLLTTTLSVLPLFTIFNHAGAISPASNLTQSSASLELIGDRKLSFKLTTTVGSVKLTLLCPALLLVLSSVNVATTSSIRPSADFLANSSLVGPGAAFAFARAFARSRSRRLGLFPAASAGFTSVLLVASIAFPIAIPSRMNSRRRWPFARRGDILAREEQIRTGSSGRVRMKASMLECSVDLLQREVRLAVNVVFIVFSSSGLAMRPPRSGTRVSTHILF